MSNSKNPIKQRILFLAKLSFVGALLFFLVQKGFISMQATQQALLQWEKILPAFALFIVTLLLGVVRWQWLLQAQGIHLKWSRTFQLTLIGNFFNIALPGAVSGDFVKAFYVGKELKGNKTNAFGSILFDRVAGVSALVLVSGVSLAIGYPHSFDHSFLSAIQYLVTTASLCVLFFYAYLFLVKEHHDPLLRLFRFLEKKIAKVEILTRVYTRLRIYHNHRWTVLKVLALSAIIHLMVGWCCLSFASALGDVNLSLLSVYVVVPLGLLITAIPIAPAGVGTGNIAFLYFFHLIGSERGADVYSLFALTNILFGFVGGLVYSRFKSHEHLPELNSIAATD